MVKGSSSKAMDKSKKQKGTSSNPTNDVKIETFVPKRDHDPRDLRSWAKRTGFVSLFSGESTASTSNTRNNLRNERVGNDSIEERENDGNRKRGETDAEIQPLGNGIQRNRNGNGNEERREFNENTDVLGSINEERRVGVDENGNNGGGNEFHEGQNMEFNGENEGGLYGKSPNLEDPILRRQPKVFKVKSGILDNPGFVPVIYYGFQHYFSIAGSLVLIPLIMVPAMGGTDKDTANVVSTVLLVSGITTLLHSFLGTRLPLVQGGSFVYLAPALVIMNSEEFRNLTQHKFRYIMRELQGAIMIGSLFQCMLGFSGLMSLLLRLINPVVVAPTMAAVGLAFFSYGFPQAGSCVEISIPLIVLLLFFTLYIRGVFISGHRIFQIYAVPLSIMIVWTYALFLTVGGAYNFKGCSPNIPSSNILVDACIKHAYTMKHCRTDVSDAWSTSAWVRIPYPLQWGIPIFRFRTSIIMIIVSLVSSVDSVATYYSASLKVNSKPPTPGIVTRGIGMEGFCSLLAGLWGTGTGSTTLTENVHTISITEVANRKGVQLGAVLLILLSFIGKVGGILASIPLALAASVLCFIWALTVALGLLNLQFTQASSVRNMGIVGVSLFLGLSIPAYFQQFQPEINLILPSYLIPYAAASNGPIHTGNKQFDFAMNALLSMNMVVSFLIAFVLDNTVPGTKQERGVYKWSTSEDLATDASSQASYKFPSGVSRACCWAKCLGV
ncbi:nucleobase-ascorbate transporter 11-like [Chenopodium quinoa]|uniref:nucleobase-ascorbate transporter 11-like n=1 Tax=Chenopodium quinoa TaxID=63459 RepID=UPI000B774AA8|nr:nucleobase-ascorbate transporter 11-like [Chenopodium quinoa]